MHKLIQKHNHHISAFKSHKNYLPLKKNKFAAQIQSFANDHINDDNFIGQIIHYPKFGTIYSSLIFF